MGQQQSIPQHHMKAPRFRPKHKPRGEGTRPLYWAVHRLPGLPKLLGRDAQLTVELDADVALCFGDVARVLVQLGADDAEFDDDDYKAEDDGDYAGGAVGSRRRRCASQQQQQQQRRLHHGTHKRPRFEHGLPVKRRSSPDPLSMQVVYAGCRFDLARQICDDSGLQKLSTLHVLIPPHDTQWRALPRPPPPVAHHGGTTRRWSLPRGWDDDLCAVVANHDSLHLSGRTRAIRAALDKISEHESMRLLPPPSMLLHTPSIDGESLVERLMSLVTDKPVDDPPLEFLVALRPPGDIYHHHHDGVAQADDWDDKQPLEARAGEIVVHVQLPSTYPLARERCRVVTPILHPLVAPLCGETETEVDSDSDSDGDGGGRDIARLSFHAGRIAFAGHSTLDAELQAFWASLADPVACARRFAAEHPKDAAAHDVLLWLTEGPEMEARARRVAKAGLRWRPELHGACPRAFRVEVREVMLARQRGCLLGELPLEVLWHLFQVLLARHLSSTGGLLFF